MKKTGLEFGHLVLGQNPITGQKQLMSVTYPKMQPDRDKKDRNKKDESLVSLVIRPLSGNSFETILMRFEFVEKMKCKNRHRTGSGVRMWRVEREPENNPFVPRSANFDWRKS
jgi:hypothetical protein